MNIPKWAKTTGKWAGIMSFPALVFGMGAVYAFSDAPTLYNTIGGSTLMGAGVTFGAKMAREDEQAEGLDKFLDKIGLTKERLGNIFGWTMVLTNVAMAGAAISLGFPGGAFEIAKVAAQAGFFMYAGVANMETPKKWLKKGMDYLPQSWQNKLFPEGVDRERKKEDLITLSTMGAFIGGDIALMLYGAGPYAASALGAETASKVSPWFFSGPSAALIANSFGVNNHLNNMNEREKEEIYIHKLNQNNSALIRTDTAGLSLIYSQTDNLQAEPIDTNVNTALE